MRKAQGWLRHWPVALVVGAATAVMTTGEPGAQGRVAPAGRGAMDETSRSAVARGQGGVDVTGLTPERAEAVVDATRRRLDYVPGEVVVKFRSGTSEAAQDRALRALRSRPSASSLRWRGAVARLTDASEPDAHVLSRQLASQPEVEYAHPNYIRRIPAAASDRVRLERVAASVAARPAGVPNDPDYGSLQWNLTLLNMPEAWNISPGGISTVTVAVVDTGFTTTTTTLNRPLWTGQRFENVDLRFDVNPDVTASRVVSPRDFAFEPGTVVHDMDGHGTHVSSTIAEDANNARSLAGIAYRTRLMPVKVCFGFWEIMIERAAFGVSGYVPTDSGGCLSEDIAAEIRDAANNGARVINLSLGGASPAPVERDAILYAIGRGVFVATSSGNNFESGNLPEYPAAYAPTIDGFMSVGAIGKSRTRAHYSPTGSHIEIAAPGGSSRDGGGEDDGFIWQVTLQPSDQNVFVSPRPRFDRYVEVGYSGTSMAAAHVSATAALLVSQGVTSPRAIEAILKSTALDLGTSGRDDSFGNGLIQPRAALFGMGIRK